MSRHLFLKLTIFILVCVGLINGVRTLLTYNDHTPFYFTIAPIVLLLLGNYIGYKFGIHQLFKNSIFLGSWLFVPISFFVTHITLTDQHGFGAAFLLVISAASTLAYVLIFFMVAFLVGKYHK